MPAPRTPSRRSCRVSSVNTSTLVGGSQGPLCPGREAAGLGVAGQCCFSLEDSLCENPGPLPGASGSPRPTHWGFRLPPFLTRGIWGIPAGGGQSLHSAANSPAPHGTSSSLHPWWSGLPKPLLIFWFLLSWSKPSASTALQFREGLYFFSDTPDSPLVPPPSHTANL